MSVTGVFMTTNRGRSSKRRTIRWPLFRPSIYHSDEPTSSFKPKGQRDGVDEIARIGVDELVIHIARSDRASRDALALSADLNRNLPQRPASGVDGDS
jgi:hypothetical protein